MRIGDREIGYGHPVLVVAELSGNHRQDWARAVALVQAAHAAGADAVKGQCFRPDGMTIDVDDAAHRLTWAGQSRTLHSLYAETALPYEWHERLMALCRELGMLYFASEFTPADVDHMDAIGAPCHKCASFELTDLPLVAHMAAKGKPVILSTGLATYAEIQAAQQAAQGVSRVLLKCTSAYPAPIEDAHLADLVHLPALYTGLSDHSRSNVVVAAAVALGASMVERHLTLSRADGGPDAAFSDEPDEFAALVRTARAATAAVGHGPDGPTASERPNLVLRRSLWVTADIAAGERFTADNVASLRPLGGLPPAELPRVLGRTAGREYRRGEPLTL